MQLSAVTGNKVMQLSVVTGNKVMQLSAVNVRQLWVKRKFIHVLGVSTDLSHADVELS